MSELREKMCSMIDDATMSYKISKMDRLLDDLESLILDETKELREALEMVVDIMWEEEIDRRGHSSSAYLNAKRVLERCHDL